MIEITVELTRTPDQYEVTAINYDGDTKETAGLDAHKAVEEAVRPFIDRYIRGSNGKTAMAPVKKSAMRCTLRCGRALFAAPYRSSNSTMGDIASGRPSPIAVRSRVRTGEVRSFNTAMTAFVSRQIIRQRFYAQAAWQAAAVRPA